MINCLLISNAFFVNICHNTVCMGHVGHSNMCAHIAIILVLVECDGCDLGPCVSLVLLYVMKGLVALTIQ